MGRQQHRHQEWGIVVASVHVVWCISGGQGIGAAVVLGDGEVGSGRCWGWSISVMLAKGVAWH